MGGMYLRGHNGKKLGVSAPLEDLRLCGAR